MGNEDCWDHNLAEAEAKYKRALAVREKAHTVGNPEAVDIMSVVGDCYLSERKWAEGEATWSKVLDTRERKNGVNAPETEYPLLRLICAKQNLGKTESVVNLVDRVLGIYEKHGFTQNADSYLSGFASYFVAQKKYDNAKSMWNKIILLRQKKFGPHSKEVAEAQQQIAKVDQLKQAGQVQKANGHI
jgi:tetratricopeptide (TPR) repeat protein